MEEKTQMHSNGYVKKLLHPETVNFFFGKMGGKAQLPLNKFFKNELHYRNRILDMIFEDGNEPLNGKVRKMLSGNKKERVDDKNREDAIKHLQKIGDEALKIMDASHSIADKHEKFGKSYGEWNRYTEAIRRNCSAMRKDAKSMERMMELKTL